MILPEFFITVVVIKQWVVFSFLGGYKIVILKISFISTFFSWHSFVIKPFPVPFLFFLKYQWWFTDFLKFSKLYSFPYFNAHITSNLIFRLVLISFCHVSINFCTFSCPSNTIRYSNLTLDFPCPSLGLSLLSKGSFVLFTDTVLFVAS